MSIKVAIGAKIYDISQFSDQESENVQQLAKALNVRVNQIISAFGIYDQEFSLLLAALSLLEELKTKSHEPLQMNLLEKESYSKKEVEEMMLGLVKDLNEKLSTTISKFTK